MIPFLRVLANPARDGFYLGGHAGAHPEFQGVECLSDCLLSVIGGPGHSFVEDKAHDEDQSSGDRPGENVVRRHRALNLPPKQ